MNYLICYDLDQPGQDYSDVITTLENMGAQRIQYSVWLLGPTNETPVQIFNRLARFVDRNDRLFVVGTQNNAAWRNMMIADDTVKQILAA